MNQETATQKGYVARIRKESTGEIREVLFPFEFRQEWWTVGKMSTRRARYEEFLRIGNETLPPVVDLRPEDYSVEVIENGNVVYTEFRKFLPCPFCGGEAKPFVGRPGVMCVKCKAGIIGEGSRERWNRRAK